MQMAMGKGRLNLSAPCVVVKLSSSVESVIMQTKTISGQRSWAAKHGGIMFCPNCAAEHVYGLRYCKQCGTNLLDAPTPQAPALPAPPKVAGGALGRGLARAGGL